MEIELGYCVVLRVEVEFGAAFLSEKTEILMEILISTTRFL